MSSSSQHSGSYQDAMHHPYRSTTSSSASSAGLSGPYKHTAALQITHQDAIYLWSNSVLLATNFEISESLLEHKRLLSVCGNTIPRSLIHFNIGSLWSVANDTHRAIQAFEQSCLEDPTLALSWFCLGVSHFSTENYSLALDAFETCLSTYALDSEMVKTYEPQGLDFKIEKTKVSWNIHLTKYRLAKQMGTPPPRLVLNNPLNTIRKDLYFDAPEIYHANGKGEGDCGDSSWKAARRRSSLNKLKGRFQKIRYSFRGSQDGEEKRDSGLGDDTASMSTMATVATRRSQGTVRSRGSDKRRFNKEFWS